MRSDPPGGWGGWQELLPSQTTQSPATYDPENSEGRHCVAEAKRRGVCAQSCVCSTYVDMLSQSVVSLPNGNFGANMHSRTLAAHTEGHQKRLSKVFWTRKLPSRTL